MDHPSQTIGVAMPVPLIQEAVAALTWKDVFAQAEKPFTWRDDVDLAALDLADVGLLTIDVFDTAVLRVCGDPAGVHTLLETAARAEGALSDAAPSGGFPRLRARLESEARQAAVSGEVGLADIYRRLPPQFGDGAALVPLEIAIERRVLIANPFIVDLMREARTTGLPVWLISDTFYDEKTLAGLLASCGISATLYDRLLASCDHGCSKVDGRLFDLALAKVAPVAGWVHIGDNPAADVASAAARGALTIYYRAPSRLRRIEEREELTGGAPDGALRTGRRLVARKTAPADPETAFWFDLGRFVIGPAVYAFCADVVRRCMASGVRRIAPFMREGALFAEAIRREAARQGFDADIRPLFISREALRLPLSDGFDVDALVRLAGKSAGLTLGEALNPFGLEALLFDDLAARRDQPLADLLGETGFTQRIGDFLASSAAQSRITAAVEAARRATGHYLDRALGDAVAVATVDFGARGTAQGLLDRLFGQMPDIGARRIFHHYLLYAVADAFGNMTSCRGGWQAFAGLDDETLNRAAVIYRSPQLIELALLGDLPTTIGYRSSADGVAEPVLLPAAGGPDQARKLAACRRGIGYACVALGELAETRPAFAAQPISGRGALDALFGLTQAPSPEEARAAADLLYDMNDGIRTAQPLADAAALAAARRLDPLHPATRVKLALSMRPSILPWPQAALTLLDDGAMTRICEAGRPGLRHDCYVRLLLELLRAEGVDRVVLCAAGGLGGMGPTFLEMAPQAGVSTVGYFDYFSEASGAGVFMGAPVLAAADLAGQPCADVAIVSMGYAETLADMVERAFTAAGRRARIIMLPLHAR
jgi:hypothetical protein